MNPSIPLSQFKKIGTATLKKLDKLNLKTVQNLLYHYPFRYEDWSKILTVAELKTKKSGTVKAKVTLIANHRSPRKRMVITEAIIADKTDSLKVIWFNQPFLATTLRTGVEAYFAGKIDYDETYGLELLNPSYEIVNKKEPIHTGRLVPVYPTTASLSQKQIRSLIRQALPLSQTIEDWLPREIRTTYNLPALSMAIEQIHFPSDKKWLERCLHRLKFDELFLIQIQNQLLRRELQKYQAPKIKFDLDQTKAFVEQLPFKLTESQRKSAWEVLQDLEQSKPTNRLLEGDVGSGKTMVAIIAILNAYLSHYQAAYMAPTEILARQHFETIKKFLGHKSLRIALLTHGDRILGNEKISPKNLQEKIINHEVDVIVGTHALISAHGGSASGGQERITFANLGLAIIDEQHRFGVEQRSKLSKNAQVNQEAIKNFSPHFLSMTATPIPRSLALTLYGDLDLSIIDEMPAGRKKIITEIVKPSEREKNYEFIREQIKSGRQAFIICPLIDPSDKLGVKSVKEEYDKLKKTIFPDMEIGLLHGRLKAEEKEKIMKRFLKNEVHILVSTTVVEVGIDVSNASIMIIEGAERFGLAQLYQLRGRIGRGEHQSYCFLFTDSQTLKTYQRLKALLVAKNSFELAEKDLELRGPGEIFGTEQSGYLESLKIAKLTDSAIVKEAQEAADKILSGGSQLRKYPGLYKKIQHIQQSIHLE
ncbi:MAG: ATP-dependent DNA helicase RecG [Patescibacteria group bacterium]|nr:ATP-dependent DNA helicase RecG [Patescibacteria group bacterium]MDD5121752.1 ATP-dependent DNA helicase RecG [Patescibacteria group bacterium]